MKRRQTIFGFDFGGLGDREYTQRQFGRVMDRDEFQAMRVAMRVDEEERLKKKQLCMISGNMKRADKMI